MLHLSELEETKFLDDLVYEDSKILLGEFHKRLFKIHKEDTFSYVTSVQNLLISLSENQSINYFDPKIKLLIRYGDLFITYLDEIAFTEKALFDKVDESIPKIFMGFTKRFLQPAFLTGNHQLEMFQNSIGKMHFLKEYLIASRTFGFDVKEDEINKIIEYFNNQDHSNPIHLEIQKEMNTRKEYRTNFLKSIINFEETSKELMEEYHSKYSVLSRKTNGMRIFVKREDVTESVYKEEREKFIRK